MKKWLLLLYFIKLLIPLTALAHPTTNQSENNKLQTHSSRKPTSKQEEPKAPISELSYNSSELSGNSSKQKADQSELKDPTSEQNTHSSNASPHSIELLGEASKQNTHSTELLGEASKQNTHSTERNTHSSGILPHSSETIALNKKQKANTSKKKTQPSTQKEPTDEQNAPMHKPQRYGLRLGVDISKPIRSIFDKNYSGIELVADYRIKKNTYVALELGKESKNSPEQYFHYTTSGKYFKAGADYNIYPNWKGIQNIIYIGGRYAMALYEQKLLSYVPHTLHRYWQEEEANLQKIANTNYEPRHAHFLEMVLGIKVELLNNLYAGLSVRVGVLLYQQKKDFPNLYLPSFGRVWEASKIGASYNYTLSYMLPLKKKT